MRPRFQDKGAILSKCNSTPVKVGLRKVGFGLRYSAKTLLTELSMTSILIPY